VNVGHRRLRSGQAGCQSRLARTDLALGKAVAVTLPFPFPFTDHEAAGASHNSGDIIWHNSGDIILNSHNSNSTIPGTSYLIHTHNSGDIILNSIPTTIPGTSYLIARVAGAGRGRRA
jgi:hypothetical protein